MQVRLADPDRDADAVATIYRPAIESTIASFEEVPPAGADMAERMRSVLSHTPWLVACDDDGRVIGYAYATRHRERAGYRWSVDVSVYVDAAHHGRGVGRRLYEELFALLRRQGFVNAYAGIALPNPASVALHEAMGMRRVALYERVGWKFGAWHDVAWYGIRLAEPEGQPPEPIPLPGLHVDGPRASA